MSMTTSMAMEAPWRSRAGLRAHIRDTLNFYEPRCTDTSGGFFHFYKDDGAVYDRHTRHLVSSARFVFNFALAWRQFGNPADLQRLRHGLAFLRDVHRDPATGGYAWLLDWRNGGKTVLDATNHCYGLAFVLLATAHAVMAGVTEARAMLRETFALMETRFWQPAHGLYADEANADWSVLSPYRGQNANMHACEALIAAFEATGEQHYLHRAEMLARHITQRQGALAGALVWEHYRADWSVDWDYNRDDKSNIFRPWGYQTGHLTEWTKLLLILDRHHAHLQGPADWLLPLARHFFDTALARGWDTQHGGICYGFDTDGAVCDDDKYFWVQAESLAAAALLAERSGEAIYRDWYERICAYCWAHFVDHDHGGWYRILSPDNRKLSDEKSPAGKTDYHTLGACEEVLKLMPA